MNKQAPSRPNKPSAAPEVPQSVGLRKRPWLLVLAATMVALWITFLAIMAWHG